MNRQVKRRSLLKLAAAGALGHPMAAQIQPRAKESLPGIPGLSDLASDPLVHRFRDHFNPPAAQNEWGYLQATKSVSGITGISFPPFGCCGIPRVPAAAYLVTCELYLDGKILASHGRP